MHFTVNSQIRESEAEVLLLLDFLKAEQLDAKEGIAVALNQQVVPRNEWASKTISENDQIIIIKATQGG